LSSLFTPHFHSSYLLELTSSDALVFANDKRQVASEHAPGLGDQDRFRAKSTYDLTQSACVLDGIACELIAAVVRQFDHDLASRSSYLIGQFLRQRF